MSDQHLVIEVTALQDELYRITIKSSDGEFAVETISPFEKADLRSYLTLLSQGNPDLSTPEINETIILFGEKLFHFLIGAHPDILTAYRKGLERAGNRRLFISLSCENGGRFAALPWEFLCDGEMGFLALSRHTPIIRLKPGLNPRRPAPLFSPLKALIVIPSPPNYPALQADAEWKRLHKATLQLQISGALHLERLEHPTWTALRRQLQTEDYEVLHYIGYTHYDEPTRQGFLAMEDDSFASGSNPVGAAELGNEIGLESTVRLVILNAHLPVDNKVLAALSNQLLQAGVASIVATQFQHDQSENIFNRELYAPLCEAHPIEAAINVARRAVAEQTLSPDWGQVALYLRTANGHLFRPVNPSF